MKKKVSVLCVVFNHEKYISRALNSIFSQKTQFEFEVIVHDDASTDGTKAILEKYKTRYGKKLKVYYEEENKYSRGELQNILNDIILNEAEGDYIALCEGDDYWLDDNKLQIQVDYMDNHQDCVMSGHNSLWVDNTTNEITVCNGVDSEGRVSISELIGNRNGCFSTASIVLRKEKYVLPKPFSECGIGDWPMKLYSAEQGYVYYFNRIMSVYNLYTDNSWSKNTLQLTNKIIHEMDMITFFIKLNCHWNYMYENDIQTQIDSCINDIIYQIESKGEIVSTKIADINDLTNRKYQDAYEMINRKIILREKEDSELKAFVGKHIYNCIMGCGVKAKKLTEHMQKLNIDIDGYVVSNNQIVPFEYNKKKVWRLRDLPFEKKDVAVIIGIQSDIRDEIIESLNENGFNDFFWPSV